jgi:hypothetical protein
MMRGDAERPIALLVAGLSLAVAVAGLAVTSLLQVGSPPASGTSTVRAVLSSTVVGAGATSEYWLVLADGAGRRRVDLGDSLATMGSLGTSVISDTGYVKYWASEGVAVTEDWRADLPEFLVPDWRSSREADVAAGDALITDWAAQVQPAVDDGLLTGLGNDVLDGREIRGVQRDLGELIDESGSVVSSSERAWYLDDGGVCVVYEWRQGNDLLASRNAMTIELGVPISNTDFQVSIPPETPRMLLTSRVVDPSDIDDPSFGAVGFAPRVITATGSITAVATVMVYREYSGERVPDETVL